MKLKPITTDNFDFETLRNAGALYVDKTKYVWQLVNSSTSIYFLTRPRRFGKSLLLSTLKAYFCGKKKLFEGLKIERLANEDDWQEWPVVHLDMAQASSFGGFEEQRKALDFYIGRVARNLGMEVKDEPATALFQTIIDHLYKTGKRVVILIDEYDKPILDALQKSHLADTVGLMQSFYQVVKSNVDKERFVFITGVSKFAHTSIFSGFNNPEDITQRTEYAAMLGYTEQELRENFAEHIKIAAAELSMDEEALIEKLKLWYDGFRFTSDAAHVFNPLVGGKVFYRAKI